MSIGVFTRLLNYSVNHSTGISARGTGFSIRIPAPVATAALLLALFLTFLHAPACCGRTILVLGLVWLLLSAFAIAPVAPLPVIAKPIRGTGFARVLSGFALPAHRFHSEICCCWPWRFRITAGAVSLSRLTSSRSGA